MALNLELKIKVSSHDKISKIIVRNAGQFIKILNQKDTYYKFDKGLLKLRKQNGEFELVKYNRNEKNGDRWSDYSLLYLTGENVEKYLNDIFTIETIVEKERRLYIYENTRIHLDTVKDLGQFLELETVVKNISKEDAVEEFKHVVKFLGLDLDKQIRKSYRDLMMEI